jgi:hypothetical protein
MKHYPRIDVVLERPEIRAELEEFKRLFGLGADRYGEGDVDGQLAAGFEANAVAIHIAAAVQAEPGNQSLPERQLVRYITNVAHHELLGDMAKRDEIVLSDLLVRFPAGRPPTRRTDARQVLIDELTSRPSMTDDAIELRAFWLGVWTFDQADDKASRRKRIARLRRDATN